MHFLRKRIQPLVIALLFVVGVAAVLLFVNRQIESQGNKLVKNMQLIADEQMFESEYKMLQESVADTTDNRTEIEQYVLADDRETIELLSELDEIGARLGIDLATSQLNQQTTDGVFNTLLIQYTISGSAAAVMHMIEIFEALPYHGHVTSLSLNRSYDQETGIETIKADIGLLLSIKKYDQ